MIIIAKTSYHIHFKILIFNIQLQPAHSCTYWYDSSGPPMLSLSKWLIPGPTYILKYCICNVKRSIVVGNMFSYLGFNLPRWIDLHICIISYYFYPFLIIHKFACYTCNIIKRYIFKLWLLCLCYRNSVLTICIYILSA